MLPVMVVVRLMFLPDSIHQFGGGVHRRHLEFLGHNMPVVRHGLEGGREEELLGPILGRG